MMILYLMFLSLVSISTGLLGTGLDKEFWKSTRGNIMGMPKHFLEERDRVPTLEERDRVPTHDDGRNGKIRLLKRKDYFSQLAKM